MVNYTYLHYTGIYGIIFQKNIPYSIGVSKIQKT